MSVEQISQRDLRLRSREIMDAVERGHSFEVTRDGRAIASLDPLRPRRTFVPVSDLVAAFRGADPVDLDALREELDAVADPALNDPFAR